MNPADRSSRFRRQNVLPVEVPQNPLVNDSCISDNGTHSRLRFLLLSATE